MPPLTQSFYATSSVVQYDSVGTMPIGLSTITKRWFDSDSAMMFAEINGGSQFRSSYHNVLIEATLQQDISSPNFVLSWWVTYHSDVVNNKKLILEIDADKGTILKKETL